MKQFILIIAVVFNAYLADSQVQVGEIHVDENITIIKPANAEGNGADTNTYHVIGEIYNGKETGEWLWSFQAGNPYFKAKYIDGLLEGQLIAYSKTGSIILEVIMQQGSPNRKLSEEESKALSLINFGIRKFHEKRNKIYYPNGQIKIFCTLDGNLEVFHENGDLSISGTIYSVNGNHIIDIDEVINYFTEGIGRYGNLGGNPFQLVEPFDIENQTVCYLKTNGQKSWIKLPFKYIWKADVIIGSKEKPIAIYKFQDGIPKNDFRIEYHPNGKIKFKSDYFGDCENVDSTFYENGIVKSIKNYKVFGEWKANFQFLPNKSNNSSYLLSGTSEKFYENGDIRERSSFLFGKPDGEIVLYYEGGAIASKSMFKNFKREGEYSEYYENGNVKTKASFKAGNQVGEILYFDKEGNSSKHSEEERYVASKQQQDKLDNDKQLASNSEVNNNSVNSNKSTDKQIYSIIEEMPTFIGGEAELNRFIAKYIKYPVEAMEGGIQGTVYLRFVIENDGEISNIEVLKRNVTGGYKGLDNEAIRVVKSMPKWNAGKQGGKTVRSYYNLPVNFQLR
ncbi:MAG: TonB family protein [Bacteroidia bacterium]|jgi:protein TonB|nr:TonB family protein [Bacteroidia bacterium]